MSSSKNVIRRVFVLLKALAVNSPVLKFYDLFLSSMIMLIVDRGQGDSAMNLLIDCKTPRIDEFMKGKDIIRVLTEVNSDFAVYFYTETKRGNERLKDLIAIARNGQLAGRKINAPILVVSESLPHNIRRDNVFTICINGELNKIERISESEVVPDDERIPIVLDRMELVISECGSLEKAVFRSAACFIYGCMTDDRESELSGYLELADMLVERNADSEDDENMEALVLKELYAWQENSGFSEVYELPYLDNASISNIENIILYDDQYVYIAEKLFKSVMRHLQASFPFAVVLSNLAQSGLIVPGSVGTYTAKLGFYDTDKNYRRRSCLRLRRDRLEELGEQGFIERCLM